MSKNSDISNILSYKEQVYRSNTWGQHFVFLNTLLAIAVGSVYLYAAPETESFVSFVYLIASWLGQMSFLAFMVYLIVFFPLSFIGRFKIYKWLCITGAFFFHILLLVDAKLFLSIKAHLSWGVFSLMMRDFDFNSGLNFRFLYIAVIVLAALMYLFSKHSTRELYRRQKRHNMFPAAVVSVLCLCFISSHALHIWADAVAYEKITTLRSVLPYHYPMTAKSFLSNHGLLDVEAKADNHTFAVKYPRAEIVSEPDSRPKNVIVIMLNGLSYNDVNAKDMPKLHSLKGMYSSYENHYLPYEDLDDNIFASAYGIPVQYKNTLLTHRTAPVTVDEMQAQEYILRVFTSESKNLLNQSIIPMAGARKSSLNYLPHDRQLFDKAGDFIQTINSDQPFLLSIMANDVLSPVNADIKRRHASLKALDAMVGDFIKMLEQRDILNNSMVIISSAKGNPALHNNLADFSMDEQHIPLIVLWPQEKFRGLSFDGLTSSFDLNPTIGIEILKIQTPYVNYTIGNSLLKIDNREYFVTSRGNSLLLISDDLVTVYRKNGRAYIDENGEEKVVVPNLETLIKAMSEINRFKG